MHKFWATEIFPFAKKCASQGLTVRSCKDYFNIVEIPPWNLKSVFTPLNGTFEREKTKKEEGGNIGGADSGESSDLPSIQIGDNCINYFCSGYE